MIHDAFLRFATSQRPLLSLGTGPRYYPLPTGATGSAASVRDLRAAQDLGAGRELVAQFDVTAAFASSDAGINASFAIAVTTDEGFTDLTNMVILSQSQPFVLSGLVPGASVTLGVPRLPSLALQTTGPIAVAGRQFLSLGMIVFTTTIGAAATLFSAGGVDAYLMLDTDPNERRTHLYPSGVSFLST